MIRLVLGRAVTEADVDAARAEHGWEATYRHDPELDVAYLEVADEQADAIRNSLEVPTLERLLTAFQIAPLAIARVGIAAPATMDPLVYEAFDEAFDHPEEDVRLTAGARPAPARPGARRGARGQAMASTMALNVALGRIAFDARAGSGRKYPPISTVFP